MCVSQAGVLTSCVSHSSRGTHCLCVAVLSQSLVQGSTQKHRWASGASTASICPLFAKHSSASNSFHFRNESLGLVQQCYVMFQLHYCSRFHHVYSRQNWVTLCKLRYPKSFLLWDTGANTHTCQLLHILGIFAHFMAWRVGLPLIFERCENWAPQDVRDPNHAFLKLWLVSLLVQHKHFLWWAFRIPVIREFTAVLHFTKPFVDCIIVVCP